MPLTTRAFWDGDHPASLICRAIVSETPDAKSYLFGLDDCARLAFEPGQFMNFTFMVDGRPETRCYSISSSAARDALIAISVKRVAGGRVSNWLFDGLRVGDHVTADGPAGLFTAGEHLKSPLLLLSAGSGITPVASMMRSFADLALDLDLVFLHFARSPEDMIFRDEMPSWAKALPRARVMAVASRPTSQSGWVGPFGRLSERLLDGLVPDLARRIVMCCGPKSFMATAKAIALKAGVPPGAFHEESFVALDPVDEVDAGEPFPVIFDLEFKRTGRTIPCPAGMTVFKAAQAAKIPIQTSCGRGICGTCRIKLASGTVDMRPEGGIKQREIDQGWILTCCSKPTSNITIEK